MIIPRCSRFTPTVDRMRSLGWVNSACRSCRVESSFSTGRDGVIEHPELTLSELDSQEPRFV